MYLLLAICIRAYFFGTDSSILEDWRGIGILFGFGGIEVAIADR